MITSQPSPALHPTTLLPRLLYTVRVWSLVQTKILDFFNNILAVLSIPHPDFGNWVSRLHDIKEIWFSLLKLSSYFCSSANHFYQLWWHFTAKVITEIWEHGKIARTKSDGAKHNSSARLFKSLYNWKGALEMSETTPPGMENCVYAQLQ